MVSAADILLRIRGQDQTGGAFKSVEEKANTMKSTLSSAVGMAMGMVGYDLVNSFMEAGRGAINASGQMDYFAGRLKMTEQQSADFRKQIDDMQSDFKKVNMTSVGATAEDLAARFQLPINKLGDLTKMTAVMSSEFVRQGRSQEDAVLAVGDAMDGQFKRLQEIGITQDTLKNNGWNGNLEDQASLIDALNTSMEKLGYDDIAKDITNLDDAYQALTVSGGNLIASVLVPLTPIIVQVTDALIGAVDFVKNNGWAQGALLIGGLAVGFGLFAGALSVAAAAEGGLMALMPGFVTSLYGAASGFMAISVAGAPLWAIVAALAAVALAVYEVGIYFGWWTDVSSMLAAISDGVRRLWEAFINSPQVQGAISMVQSALQQLWNFIQPVFTWISQAWANLFGDSGSNPDIVSGIISAFTQLGNIASNVFSFLVNIGGQVYTALEPIIGAVRNIVVALSAFASGQAPLERTVLTVLTMVGRIYTTIGQLMLRIGQMIFNGIVNALRPIPGRIWSFLMQAIARLLVFGTIAAVRARQAGQRILQGIVNYIMRLPGRVGSYMMQVPGRIASAAGAAVGAAASLASQVVQAVTSGVTGVADAVYNEFMNIGSKINSAVSGAVSAASSFGDNIKNAVLNALHIASPGIIQKKIAIEFADIPGRIGESTKSVYSAARNYAGNILQGFNTPKIPLSSMGSIRENSNYTPNTTNGGNTTIVYIQEGAVPVDARNMTQKEAVGVVTAAFEEIFDNPGGVPQ